MIKLLLNNKLVNVDKIDKQNRNPNDKKPMAITFSWVVSLNK